MRSEFRIPVHSARSRYALTSSPLQYLRSPSALYHVTSVEGVPYQAFECIYSPAKRRGPVPGRTGKNNPKQEPPNYSQVVPIVFDNGVAGPSNTGLFTVEGSGIQSEKHGGELAGFEQIQRRQQQGFQNIPTGFNNPIQVNGNRAGVLDNNIMTMNDDVGAGSGTVNFSAEELKEMLIMQQQLLTQQQKVQFNQRPQIDNKMKPVLNQMQGTFESAPHYYAEGNNVVTSNANFDLNNNLNIGQLDTDTKVPTSDRGQRLANTSAFQIPQQDLTLLSSQLNASKQLESPPSLQQLQQAQPTAPKNLAPPLVSVPIITNPVASHDIPLKGDSEDLYSASSAKRRPGVNAGPPEANGLSLPHAKHIALLDPSNNDGNALRSCFELSTNDVLNLPHIPSDDEYCGRLGKIGYMCTPSTLPTYDRCALQAARFSELALGALANQQAPLALELSTASVVCLRNCVKKPASNRCLFEVARSYLLLGIFRSFRGDFRRYFKYRRVCLTYITQMNVSLLAVASPFENIPDTSLLCAAHERMFRMLNLF